MALGTERPLCWAPKRFRPKDLPISRGKMAHRLNKVATNLWTGVSGSPVAADVAAPILEGVRVIVSALACRCALSSTRPS